MQIVYDYPDMPVGTPLDFGGLMVPNGKSIELSEADLRLFRLRNGRSMQDAEKDTEHLTIIRKKVS